MGDVRNVYKILVRKRPVGRSTKRWEDRIKINIKQIGCETAE
jgi:hypothetical protein